MSVIGVHNKTLLDRLCYNISCETQTQLSNIIQYIELINFGLFHMKYDIFQPCYQNSQLNPVTAVFQTHK